MSLVEELRNEVEAREEARRIFITTAVNEFKEYFNSKDFEIELGKAARKNLLKRTLELSFKYGTDCISLSDFYSIKFQNNISPSVSQRIAFKSAEILYTKLSDMGFEVEQKYRTIVIARW